jgi:hypothetical protein
LSQPAARQNAGDKKATVATSGTSAGYQIRLLFAHIIFIVSDIVAQKIN